MADPNFPAYPTNPPPLDPSRSVPTPPSRSGEAVGEFALTPEETAEADALYDELKPMATEAAREYVLARTPAVYQEYMLTKIEADWPVPVGEDPGTLTRVQGEQGRVSIQQPAIGPDSPQRARAGQKLDPVRLELDTGRDRNQRLPPASPPPTQLPADPPAGQPYYPPQPAA